MADGLVLVVLGLVMLLQDPGRTRFDTKLDLVVDPRGFLARAFSVWDPTAGFGQLQNQAYGYLFPMGPFFGVAHSAGIPAWVTQALWAWLILATTYLGMRILATRLGLPLFAALCGALAYALAPRMVTVIGPLSSEALPAALLPWTLVPLAVRGGIPRRTAFSAALPVLFMGAINATATLAVLPVTIIWILTRGADRWRLLVWWSGFVAAFSLWWVVPLAIQAKYATPFLSYIESGRDTTSGLVPADVVRGDVHWVGGFVDQGTPWWPAGYEYTATTFYIAITLIIAAIGVLGLATTRMPERRASAWSALAGLGVLAIGSSLAPANTVWWALLDGPLAPLRNVHKFDPVLRLPLALGVAAAVAWATSRIVARLRVPVRPHDLPSPWPFVPGIAALAVIVLSAVPLVTPGLAAGRTWTEIPPWWQQAASWLAGPGGGERALVVPGSGFGRYVWGRTIDEPMQPLASGSWAIDNDLPLGSVGSGRLLDSISAVIREGRPSNGLAGALRRSGIRYVVVRNDIDSHLALAPSRSAVAATLQSSPGLTPAATFGTALPPGNAITTSDYDRDGVRPAIEIYRVDGDVPMVSATPISKVVVMTGGPESLLPALGSRVLAAGAPVVFTGDNPPEAAGGRLVVTDGLLRRDRALGRGDFSLSAVLTETEGSRLHRKGTDLVPFAAPEFTTATYTGITAVTASTSRAFADAYGEVRIDRLPFAALDGSLDTWWESSDITGPVQQWWQVDLPSPTDLRGMSLTLVQSPYVGPRVREVELTAGGQSWVVPVDAEGRIPAQRVDALAQATSLRVTAHAAEGDKGDFGIRTVDLPGVRVSRTLTLPSAPRDRGAGTDLLLTAVSPAQGPCYLVDDDVRCDPTATRAEGDAGVLDRTVTLASDLDGALALTGAVRGGPAAAELFDPLGAGIRARASSWLGGDVRVRPSAAVDGDPSTSWVADVGDTAPAITLDLGQTREISSVRLVAGTGPQRFSAPTSVRLTVGSRIVDAELRNDGAVTFTPTLASRVSVQVLRTTPIASVDGASGRVSPVPVAIAEIELGGAQDLVYHPDLRARSGAACGLGPRFTVDGVDVPTSVSTTLGDVLRDAPVDVLPCPSTSGPALTAGQHHIVVVRSRLVDPLVLAVGPPSSQVSNRDARIVSWSRSTRTIALAEGPESVLRVAESANAGWTATMDGRPLTPVRMDGWQQGWIVPAGSASTVSLEYAPERVQRTGMMAGGLVAVMALLVGLLRPRRELRWTSRPAGPVDTRVVSVCLVGLGALLLGVVGGIAGVVAVLVDGRRRAPLVTGALVLLACVAAVAGAGPKVAGFFAVAGALGACGAALRGSKHTGDG